MKLSAKTVALGLLTVALLALAGGLLFPGKYPTDQPAERSFMIPVDFTVVRKCLVHHEGAKQIITMGGGSEFVAQKWDDVGIELDPQKFLNSDWRLELHGTLTVKTDDDYVGEQVIDLAQDVEITVDKLDSHVKLKKGAERLADYEMHTTFSRGDEGQTLVELSLRQEIVTDAPWWAHRIADRRVKASVETRLEHQEAAIRQFVDENKDDVPLLPLR